MTARQRGRDMKEELENGMDCEWCSGYPRKPGWYDCLVDGREVRLRFRFCMTRGRNEWLDISGNRVSDDSQVMWTGVGDVNY